MAPSRGHRQHWSERQQQQQAQQQQPAQQPRQLPSDRDANNDTMDVLGDPGDPPQLFFFFFFLGGKDIHYTSAMIATSRVCDVHHKPERPKLTTHLEIFRHES